MKTYKPTTKSRRNTVSINYREFLTASKPYKPLTAGFKRSVGRNSQGRITTRHKGGGNKRKFRDIDFTYSKRGVPARLRTVEYDPNRSAFIGLLAYADGEKRYTIVSKDMKVGTHALCADNAPIELGNATMLKNIPVGTFVYAIEVKPGGGAKMVRSAGTFAQVVAQNDGYTQLKMPSSEVRRVEDTCFATIGEIGNSEHKLRKFGKAGRSRWRGIRPTVRGTAMNPVDHPYGGGEGRQGRGTKRPKTVYGKITGGRKTRTPKKYSNPNIISRRKVGKR
jgi:large subunit ribosomal protein L2